MKSLHTVVTKQNVKQKSSVRMSSIPEALLYIIRATRFFFGIWGIKVKQ